MWGKSTIHPTYLFSNSEISACSLRCHFSAWLNTCLRSRTLVCAVLINSVSTSPLTTAHRPSSISVISSNVYVSSTSLWIWIQGMSIFEKCTKLGHTKLCKQITGQAAVMVDVAADCRVTILLWSSKYKSSIPVVLCVKSGWKDGKRLILHFRVLFCPVLASIACNLFLRPSGNLW